VETSASRSISSSGDYEDAQSTDDHDHERPKVIHISLSPSLATEKTPLILKRQNWQTSHLPHRVDTFDEETQAHEGPSTGNLYRIFGHQGSTLLEQHQRDELRSRAAESEEAHDAALTPAQSRSGHASSSRLQFLHPFQGNGYDDVVARGEEEDEGLEESRIVMEGPPPPVARVDVKPPAHLLGTFSGVVVPTCEFGWSIIIL
jgi:hypothetical protein